MKLVATIAIALGIFSCIIITTNAQPSGCCIGGAASIPAVSQTWRAYGGSNEAPGPSDVYEQLDFAKDLYYLSRQGFTTTGQKTDLQEEWCAPAPGGNKWLIASRTNLGDCTITTVDVRPNIFSELCINSTYGWSYAGNDTAGTVPTEVYQVTGGTYYLTIDNSRGTCIPIYLQDRDFSASATLYSGFILEARYPDRFAFPSGCHAASSSSFSSMSATGSLMSHMNMLGVSSSSIRLSRK